MSKPLRGVVKPPCEYPLSDGRRCCECEACQAAAHARGRSAALRHVAKATDNEAFRVELLARSEELPEYVVTPTRGPTPTRVALARSGVFGAVSALVAAALATLLGFDFGDDADVILAVAWFATYGHFIGMRAEGNRHNDRTTP